MPETTQKILVIGHVWPEPQATAAGQRMLQLLHCWKELDYDISFASAATRTEFSQDLNLLGIDEIGIQLNNSSFDRMITKLNPEVVVFDRFMTEEQYGWRVAEHLPGCLRILNTEDLHSLREARRNVIDSGRDLSTGQWLTADIAKRELASIYRSDLSLIISTFEERWLVERAGIPRELLVHIPFIYKETGSISLKALPEFAQRKDFAFIGNGKHDPNIDAVQWLYHDLWPLIRMELPEANLHIYGAYLPRKILSLHQPEEGFHVHGWIEDSRTTMSKIRVNLVPLRYGAGLKGKIVEAMSCGTPNVATNFGWEGIREPDNLSNTVVDFTKNFVQTAVRLYLNKEVWVDQQAEEHNIFTRSFEQGIYKSIMSKRIASLRAHLDEHRQNNFVGSLLMHQTMASTKYMAKWIEAKNRK